MTVKLSELEGDVMLFQDEETPISVKDLRHELANGTETRTEGWSIAVPTVWTPDAESMIERYVDAEAWDLWEDADVRMMDELSPHIKEIQRILDGIGVPYWECGEMVEIDGSQGEGDAE